MFDTMLRFIGQITVTLAARDRCAAQTRLRSLSRQLAGSFSDVLFADHRGEVDPYWPVTLNGGMLVQGQVGPCFDSFEIHGIVLASDEQGSYREPVDDSEAELWCLYGHLPGQGLKAIGTFSTREEAEAVYAGLTGRPYHQPDRQGRRRNSAA